MKLREKYSAKKSASTKNSYSSFWFDRKSSVDDMLGYDMSTGEILDTKPKPKKNQLNTITSVSSDFVQSREEATNVTSATQLP